MPRRRPTKSSSKTKSKPRPVDRASASIKRWNTVDDIPLDEEEQFHANRDRILLEGNDDDSDFDGIEDEVFALEGMPDNDEEDEEEDDYPGSDGEDADEDIQAASSSSKKAQKSTSSKKKKKDSVPSSSSESEEEEETWGHKKSAYYSSNANDIDSEDEEANELEEQEAIRLQMKSREALDEDAFGFSDQVEDMTAPDDTSAFPAQQEMIVDDLPQDKELILRHLAKTTPETLALARDWEDTALKLMKVKQLIEETQANEPESPHLGRMHFYYQGLLTYTTTLAFYLHLRASPKYSQRPDLLRTHPILGRLLSLKQSLSTLEDLGFDEEEGGPDSDDDLMLDPDSFAELARQGLDKDELQDLLMDALNSGGPDSLKNLLKGGAGQDSDETSEDDEDVVPASSPPKKVKKASSRSKKATKTKSSAKPVFDLEEPEFISSQTPTSTLHDSTDSFGEYTSLHSHDAADKSARRKSLRFHTSKIESASNRRQSARNSAMGGDDDIPYRDRKKEQAIRKGLGQGGEDLDAEGLEPTVKAGEKRSRQDDDDDSGDEGADGYYDLVKRKKKEKKELAQAEYDAAKEAARPDFEEDATNGPRSLTRSILKNKGLTPHRAKDVRNPRVKKKHKYEKAKRKVASQKAVYKGGLSQTGHYDGERTGITRVHKGISLG